MPDRHADYATLMRAIFVLAIVLTCAAFAPTLKGGAELRLLCREFGVSADAALSVLASSADSSKPQAKASAS